MTGLACLLHPDHWLPFVPMLAMAWAVLCARWPFRRAGAGQAAPTPSDPAGRTGTATEPSDDPLALGHAHYPNGERRPCS